MWGAALAIVGNLLHLAGDWFEAKNTPAMVDNKVRRLDQAMKDDVTKHVVEAHVTKRLEEMRRDQAE